MEVRCDKCQARYRVDDARIGPQGLTMRCGKCQNTFKVTREPAPTMPNQPPAPRPAAPPAQARPAAARPIEAPPQATMVFGQSPVAKPPPPAPKPPVAAAKATPAPADEGAGRTMMFQTGNLKTGAKAKPAEPAPQATMVFGQSPIAAKPAAAPAPKPPPRAPDPEAGATMVFGQSPIAKPAPKPPPARDEAAGSTMMFGQAPAVAKPIAPPPPKAPPQPIPEPEPPAAEEPPEIPSAAEVAAAEEPAHEEPAPMEEPADEAAEEEPAAAPGAFDRAPPKGLLIGVVAGLVALLIAGGALFAYKKFARRPPPPAAVETLTAAQADADKDTLASIASAEGKARDAIDVAGPRSAFPEAIATLARIDVQWADALNDQAALVAAKAGPDADAKAADLTAQAKAKLKAAADVLSPVMKNKDSQKSPDLQLAQADYFRAQHANTSMNKALKAAQALKADDAKVALIQGMSLAQDDDGAEKAIPKLKAALAANPNSARIHFRLALAYQATKDDANATAELKETLRLSPQHERAKLAGEANGK